MKSLLLWIQQLFTYTAGNIDKTKVPIALFPEAVTEN